MMKWEYRICALDSDIVNAAAGLSAYNQTGQLPFWMERIDSAYKEINELGDAGWELVSIEKQRFKPSADEVEMGFTDDFLKRVYVFKRPKED